ncbi:PREDICTED: uncharacterized protein LOC105562222 [Vollenhovia emeryi]|uniref:uncharacterized protein LOC105562222 n=1 Tax=Vollenhovia emeryi TaxID=411798 RepID=UPI0005F40BDB|nr:PREDICTED: uncharacterized protein LOC105562222 [Vollenhovia emeryi]
MSALKKKGKFTIVSFTKSGNDSEQTCIDCVPSAWVNFDSEKQQLVTKFMPPPYSAKRCKALHKLVKENGKAQTTWPIYEIKIVDNAGT